MDRSHQEGSVKEAGQTSDEIVQLPETELAMIGGGIADVTFS